MFNTVSETFFIDELSPDMPAVQAGLEVGDQPYEKLDGYILWNKIYPKYTPKDILKAYKTFDL